MVDIYFDVDGMVGYINVSTKTYSKLRTVECRQSGYITLVIPILPMVGNMRITNLEGIPIYSDFCLAGPVSTFGQRLIIQELSLDMKTENKTFGT